MLHYPANVLRESELTLELCTERSEMQGKGETRTSRLKPAAVCTGQRMLFACRGTGVDQQFVHQPISLMLVNCIFSAGKYLRPHVKAVFFPLPTKLTRRNRKKFKVN